MSIYIYCSQAFDYNIEKYNRSGKIMKDNPFSPTGIVKTTLFGGRSEYTLKILKKLNYVKSGRPASFYLYGERGIGKTALAKLIKFVSESKNKKLYDLHFLTSYYSAQQNQTFKSVLESSLNNIADQMSSKLLDKIGKRLGNLFSNGKFSIGAFGVQASYDGRETKKPDESIFIKDQFVSIVRNITKELKMQKGDDKYDGLLIIIDEMDNIIDLENAAQIIRGITTTLDFEDLGYLSFLFIGYQSGLERFVSGDISVKRLIDPIHLLEMPQNEVLETFEKGFNEAEINWSKDALKENAWQAGGYPLAIQVIGYHLLENDNDDNITEEDWQNSIVPSAFELREKEYSTYYSFDVKQKKNSDKIMLALALAERCGIKSLSLKDIELISKVKNPRQYLTKLLKQGVVFINSQNREYVLKRGLLRIAIVFDYYICHGIEEGSRWLDEVEAEIRSIKKINGNSNT